MALLYIFDHIFFNFAVAIRTYFQKAADPRDIAPSMAMGFTINHIAAVGVAGCGGAALDDGLSHPFLHRVGPGRGIPGGHPVHPNR